MGRLLILLWIFHLQPLRSVNHHLSLLLPVNLFPSLDHQDLLSDSFVGEFLSVDDYKVLDRIGLLYIIHDDISLRLDSRNRILSCPRHSCSTSGRQRHATPCELWKKLNWTNEWILNERIKWMLIVADRMTSVNLTWMWFAVVIQFGCHERWLS